MDVLISNLLSKSILDFGKWSNGKYANMRICVFSVWPLPGVKNLFRKPIWNENFNISIQFFLKSFGQYLIKSKNGFCIVFKIVISKWPKVCKEIDHGCFRVFGSYFIEKKSHCTTYRLTFELWSIIVRPYLRAISVKYKPKNMWVWHTVSRYIFSG